MNISVAQIILIEREILSLKEKLIEKSDAKNVLIKNLESEQENNNKNKHNTKVLENEIKLNNISIDKFDYELSQYSEMIREIETLKENFNKKEKDEYLILSELSEEEIFLYDMSKKSNDKINDFNSTIIDNEKINSILKFEDKIDFFKNTKYSIFEVLENKKNNKEIIQMLCNNEISKKHKIILLILLAIFITLSFTNALPLLLILTPLIILNITEINKGNVNKKEYKEILEELNKDIKFYEEKIDEKNKFIKKAIDDYLILKKNLTDEQVIKMDSLKSKLTLEQIEILKNMKETFEKENHFNPSEVSFVKTKSKLKQ